MNVRLWAIAVLALGLSTVAPAAAQSFDRLDCEPINDPKLAEKHRRPTCESLRRQESAKRHFEALEAMAKERRRQEDHRWAAKDKREGEELAARMIRRQWTADNSPLLRQLACEYRDADCR